MKRILQNGIFYILIVLVIIAFVRIATNGNEKQLEIKTNQFVAQLENDEIKTADMTVLRGVYEVKGTYRKGKNTYHTYVSSEQLPNILVLLDHNGVKYSTNPAEEPSLLVSLLTGFLPFILIFVLFFFLLQQSQGGGSKLMSFGKSKAKMFNKDKKQKKFDDVAGADEEKQELEELVDFLKDPRKFVALGARIPKGVLLVGPPGTGKTLLARAVAGEAGVPFFSISGSDFVEMFVGVGASRVRDLFETAKKNSPAMIFIDEIDAVGRQRGAGLGGGHDEREQTLNQLLVEMDGFGDNEGVIIIAATNRADVLDPALLRPGRFDRQVIVDVPDVKGRAAILRVHANGKPLGESVDLEAIAKRTPGFSGADLENLLNEAALLAARNDKKTIDMRDIDEATDRVIAGPAKTSKVISEKERRIVAFHEAGHALIGLTLSDADVVHKVTIVPRGQAGGYAVMLPKEDRFLMTKQELLNKIIGLLGGRVAEDLVFGEVSTGAHNDFQRATGIARRMVTEYGMSEKLGPLQFGKPQHQVFLGRDLHHERDYSENIAFQIDEEIQAIIRTCYAAAKNLLQKHRDKLDLIANSLLEVETLDEEQIKHLFEKGTFLKRTYEDKAPEVKVNIGEHDNVLEQAPVESADASPEATKVLDDSVINNEADKNVNKTEENEKK